MMKLLLDYQGEEITILSSRQSRGKNWYLEVNGRILNIQEISSRSLKELLKSLQEPNRRRHDEIAIQ